MAGRVDLALVIRRMGAVFIFSLGCVSIVFCLRFLGGILKCDRNFQRINQLLRHQLAPKFWVTGLIAPSRPKFGRLNKYFRRAKKPPFSVFSCKYKLFRRTQIIQKIHLNFIKAILWTLNICIKFTIDASASGVLQKISQVLSHAFNFCIKYQLSWRWCSILVSQKIKVNSESFLS